MQPMTKIRLIIISCLLFSCLPAMTTTASALNSAAGVAVNAGAFSNLSTAKSQLGGTVITLAVTTPQTANNLTIPSNIHLMFSGNGQLDVAEGKTVTINGPFEAPPTQVFSGAGKIIFGPGSLLEVIPEWWNGDPATIIQKAIDSISSGTVVLAARSYLLNRRVRMKLVDGSTDAVSAILVPKSGVNIRGQGYDSVLKVVDEFTAGGDYVVFAPVIGEAISDISFSNFRIDGNGARNLVQGASAGTTVRRAMAIWLFSGKNVRLENVWFENHPGTNVVKFGSDSLSYLITDSVISNCTFFNVGGAIPGNRRQSDHSTLYISGRNVSVTNNRLTNSVPYNENGPPTAVVAGIEMHGDDMVVTGNLVENYGTGGYIVADGIVTAKNHRWVGNSFISMTKLGISLWSVGAVENVLLESNLIDLNGALDQGVAGIFQSLYPPDTTVGINGITVRNNTIHGTAVKAGTVWNGIQFTAVSNALIQGNVIERISGAGILIYGNPSRPLDCRTIKIRDNSVRDTGFNVYGAYPYAIDLINNGLGRFDDIDISGNLVESTLPLAGEMRGIRAMGTSPVSGVLIRGSNRFVGLKRPEYRIDVSGVKNGVTVEPSVP